MTGSTLEEMVVPIVMIPALGAWLGLVYYAAAHPGHRAPKSVSEPGTDCAAISAAAAKADDESLPGLGDDRDALTPGVPRQAAFRA